MMKNLFQKLFKVGFAMALLLASVSVASAATFDENGNDIEKMVGYVSVQKINANPNRYVPFATRSEDEVGFLDKGSIRVIRNDSLLRLIEVKEIYVEKGIDPQITVVDQLYKYDLTQPKTIGVKHLYENVYTFNGILEKMDPRKKYMASALEGTRDYINANIIYYLVFGQPYDIDLYNRSYHL